MRNLLNINIRYGSDVPVPMTLYDPQWRSQACLEYPESRWTKMQYSQKNGEKFGELDFLYYFCGVIWMKEFLLCVD